MNNIFAALWYRELSIYRRRFVTVGLLPMLTGLLFFFMFFLPYQQLLSPERMADVLPSLVLDASILTLLITIYETTARFYWEAQRGNGMASIYEMGRFQRQPSFFMAQAIIGLIKGFLHLLIVGAILVFLAEIPMGAVNVQATLIFLLLGAAQIISLSKIIGLFTKHVESLGKLLYLGMLPVLMVSGLFLITGSPLTQFEAIAYYIPPYNWMSGLELAFVESLVDYGYLLVSVIETAFLVWLAATFFHLEGDL